MKSVALISSIKSAYLFGELKDTHGFVVVIPENKVGVKVSVGNVRGEGVWLVVREIGIRDRE